MELSRYSSPDTSDKRDDECWVEYWDRKRHERHGPACVCRLCVSERLGEPVSHAWCLHTYENDPDIILPYEKGNDCA